jgi:hypothetical protein
MKKFNQATPPLQTHMSFTIQNRRDGIPARRFEYVFALLKRDLFFCG